MKYLFILTLFISSVFSANPQYEFCSSKEDSNKYLNYYYQFSEIYKVVNNEERSLDLLFKANYFGMLYTDCLEILKH